MINEKCAAADLADLRTPTTAVNPIRQTVEGLGIQH